MQSLAYVLRRIAILLAVGLIGLTTAASVRAQVMAAPAFAPENGWWWNPDEPGQGFAIEAIGNDTLFASTLVYDTDGTPVWYVTEAKWNGVAFAGELQVHGGGQTLEGAFQPTAPVRTAGRAVFDFDSAASGTLTWSGGRTPIRRYTVGPVVGSPELGTRGGSWWFNGAERGRGFFMEARNGTLFMLAAVYDETGRPVWYTAQGPMVSPTLFEGTLIETSGGQTARGDYRPPSSVSSLGRVSVAFSDDVRATLVTPGGRQIPLVRYVVCLEAQRLARPAADAPASITFPGAPAGCGA